MDAMVPTVFIVLALSALPALVSIHVGLIPLVCGTHQVRGLVRPSSGEVVELRHTHLLPEAEQTLHLVDVRLLLVEDVADTLLVQLVLLAEHRVALGDAALRCLHPEAVGLIAQLLAMRVRTGTRVEVGDAPRGEVGLASSLRPIQIRLTQLPVQIRRLLVELADLTHGRCLGQIDLRGIVAAGQFAADVGQLLLVVLLLVEDVLLRLVQLGRLRPLAGGRILTPRR
jgi:hypothetical protein